MSSWKNIALPKLIYNKINKRIQFLLKWIASPVSIGAITPSGKNLADMMAKQVNPDKSGLVIELGPGTGPVTDALVQHGIQENRLVLVEYNKDFIKYLRKRFPTSMIIEGDAYDIDNLEKQIKGQPICAIVSGLPLRNKPEKQRRSLIIKALSLMDKNSPFIQFTYALSPPVARDDTLFILNKMTRVWWNLPPAKVCVYRPIK